MSVHDMAFINIVWRHLQVGLSCRLRTAAGTSVVGVCQQGVCQLQLQ
jgi:hypothetical protein